MINRRLVEGRLVLLHGYLNKLERLARCSRTAFLTDDVKAGAAESYLRRALEAVFDLGRHLLVKQGAVELAAEYKGIARGLGAQGIVGPELTEKLVQMAGYRNRMVHLYHLVSDEELYRIITHDLGDLREVARQIQAFVEGRGAP
ncbi:MAG TPA: DUF86 domain-containing protein [Firmicutes bacterium]|nr:DUF86 domain-containing protein [Bacillota bacterium]